jgi:hypothetical protein
VTRVEAFSDAVIAVKRLARNLGVATIVYVAFTALALLSLVAALAGYCLAAVVFLWQSDFRALGARTVEQRVS